MCVCVCPPKPPSDVSNGRQGGGRLGLLPGGQRDAPGSGRCCAPSQPFPHPAGEQPGLRALWPIMKQIGFNSTHPSCGEQLPAPPSPPQPPPQTAGSWAGGRMGGAGTGCRWQDRGCLLPPPPAPGPLDQSPRPWGCVQGHRVLVTPPAPARRRGFWAGTCQRGAGGTVGPVCGQGGTSAPAPPPPIPAPGCGDDPGVPHTAGPCLSVAGASGAATRVCQGLVTGVPPCAAGAARAWVPAW